MSSERQKRWWESDVGKVMQEADDFYARVAAVHPDKDKLPFTKKKIIEARSWAPTLSLYEKDFDRVLQQLGFFYVPGRVIPGPAFVFPIRDVDGKYTCAQTRPLEGSALAGLGKYRYIGDKQLVAGPRWLGNDRPTLKKIIDTRMVMVVEGPFDLLASRLLCPDAPVMSPLTKMLGKQHLAYLRIIGVQTLVLMYDNEEAKKGKLEGAGNVAMAQQASIEGVKVVKRLKCPMSDPSACLETEEHAKKLRTIIRQELQY